MVEDPLAWTQEQFEKGKLPATIERAGIRAWQRISTSSRSLGISGDEEAGARYVGRKGHG